MKATFSADAEAVTEPRTRRGFLGFLGRAGIVLVGTSATWVEMQRSASADGCGGGNWRCCDLAHPTGPGQAGWCPVNSSGNYYCPQGSMTEWLCCCPGGSRTYACGECTNSGNCDYGPWYYSCGWTTSPNSCVLGAPANAAPKADPEALALWKKKPWGTTPVPVYRRSQP